MKELATALDFACQPIARKRLTQDQPAHWQREIRRPRERTGFLVKMGELEAPAFRLMSVMFAGNAVEPAFQSARQPEICRIDRQHQRAVDDTAIEPVGKDK